MKEPLPLYMNLYKNNYSNVTFLNREIYSDKLDKNQVCRIMFHINIYKKI